MTQQKPSRLRSWLFIPATHPEWFTKAAEVDADALIIDLEDAVAPPRTGKHESQVDKRQMGDKRKPPMRIELFIPF